jgi:putative protein-disulfide isomerase
MCSWCWAYRPTWLQLRSNLPENVRWQNVLGGLAPDNDQPMPENMRNMIRGHWREIQSSLGTEFNFEFWNLCQARRDTYKACRAVIAAAQQQAEEAMIEAIQRAYYLRAMNTSEPDTLADLAAEMGLNRSRFANDLVSVQTETAFRRQLSLRTRLKVRSFPSLVLLHESRCSNIGHDYHDFRASLAQIQNCRNSQGAALDDN